MKLSTKVNLKRRKNKGEERWRQEWGLLMSPHPSWGVEGGGGKAKHKIAQTRATTKAPFSVIHQNLLFFLERLKNSSSKINGKKGEK